jgi:plasmid stabilization system protein ParE
MTSSIEVAVSVRARADTEDVLQYTAETWGTGQRDRYEDILYAAFERIGVFPEIGHPVEGRPSNIREFHLRHHIIQYRREPERVIILRIVNPRRRRR